MSALTSFIAENGYCYQPEMTARRETTHILEHSCQLEMTARRETTHTLEHSCQLEMTAIDSQDKEHLQARIHRHVIVS